MPGLGVVDVPLVDEPFVGLLGFEGLVVPPVLIGV